CLDQLLPLAGASHADVVRYAVDIPMRYAECFATLADGRSVRLKETQQLRGRTGGECDCLLLFTVGDRYLLLSAETGRVEELDAEQVPRRRFIARDGSLLEFHTAIETSQAMAHTIPAHRMPAFAGAALHAVH
ncbi:MAG: hypothetical protein KJP08_02875, partial [Gammaproteobacteria bacterium]|nr:hypothetical protein [Gammaproteobacteria bacterium]